jgi:hypothetical protein
MPQQLTIKTEALEPLFAAWEEPDKHRVRGDSGEGAVERKGRRPPGLAMAQNPQAMVKEWRDNFDNTRERKAGETFDCFCPPAATSASTAGVEIQHSIKKKPGTSVVALFSRKRKTLIHWGIRDVVPVVGLEPTRP